MRRELQVLASSPSASVHPRVAMEVLGHSQMNTTVNIYSHVIQDAQRDAAAKIDAVFEAGHARLGVRLGVKTR